VFPLRDLNPARSRPVLTWVLIGANVAVFAGQMAAGPWRGELLVERFGVVPADLVHGRHWGSLITPLTSMFMHGDLSHLVGNMWFMAVFADNVEDSLGRPRFLAFYTVCGLAAAATQVALDTTSTVPMIGASGAVAGVLAAYVWLFPGARVLTFLPPFFFLEVPAFIYIFVWFALQLASAYVSLAQVAQGGVAFWAHVGGFLMGLGLVSGLPRDRERPRLEPRHRGPRNVRRRLPDEFLYP
jgi:membrane associated rhomboid family serine protease